jgi:hypothetical protein
VFALVGCSGQAGVGDVESELPIFIPRPDPLPRPLPSPFVTPPWSVYGTDSPPTWGDCGPSTGSDGMRVIADVCNASGPVTGCHATGPDPTCTSYEREVFTGVSLGNWTGSGKSYNGFGGRGQAMGEAGLCILQALKDGPPLSTSTPIGLGITGSQRIGFLSFDPGSRTMKGYRQLHVDLPLLGGADLRAQTFTAQLVNWHHPYDDKVAHKLGSYLVDDGWALDLTMDRSDEIMNLELARISVPTPYGPVSVQPFFKYTAGEPVLLSPFGGTTQKTDPDFFWGIRKPLVGDVYGRFAGASLLGTFPDGGGKTGVGWDSQVALGSRGDGSLWSGKNGDQRPDFQLEQARSLLEYTPDVQVSGGLEIKKSLVDFLPSALRSDPFGTTFEVSITPHLDAKLSGQLALGYSEEAVSPDVSTMTAEDLQIKSQVVGGTTVGVIVGLKFIVNIDLPIVGWKNLVNITPTFPIDLPVGGSATTGQQATVRMGQYASQTDKNWVYDWFQKLDGSWVSDGRAFVQACLAQSPAPQSIPPATVTPGTLPTDWVDEWPCNICVGLPASPGVNPFSQVVTPSTSPAGPSWACDTTRIGCMDLCTYDSRTGSLTLKREKISGDRYCDPIR